MFGFLRLKNCSVTPEDRKLYAGHFCSLCHAMTRFGGRISSLLTNYDVTFWLLIQSALECGEFPELERKPCTALPFSKVSVRPLSDRVSQTVAALNLALVGSKIADDEQDGETWKAGVGKALYGKKIRKAREFLDNQGFKLESVFCLEKSQAHVESAARPSLDSLAQPTALALGEVFVTISDLQSKPSLAEPLREFGAELGRFLYLFDALSDLEADRKSGSFNAILKIFGKRPYQSHVHSFLTTRLEHLNSSLSNLALGPEGTLCFQLLSSLRRRVEEMLPASERPQTLGARSRLKKAGFVRTQDCDCCCPTDCCSGDCCELNCCECGSCCDCNICDCNPCESGNDECCEFNCCNLSDCCCGGGSDPGGGGECCGGGDGYNESCCDNITWLDLFCIDAICCSSSDDYYHTSGGHSSSRPGFMERFREARRVRKLDAVDKGASTNICPKCMLNMIKLRIGGIELDECRNCGGIWCDDKEIDALAKMVSLPHNLLNRYPTETVPVEFLPGERSCPQCEDQKLAGMPYLGVPVEMCEECHGFFIEHGSLRRVLKAKRSPKRLLKKSKKAAEWRCPYCERIASGEEDICQNCGAPKPRTGFTGKLD